MKISDLESLDGASYGITKDRWLAGIDEAGATEALRFIPTEEAVMEKVVSLYDYRKKE